MGGVMNITLINPSMRKSNPDLAWWKQPRSHRYPGLGLLTVAALCPPSAVVKLIEDEFEEIDYEINTDLVAISTLTVNTKRAYKISERFRDRNIPVILGGIHATACPEESSHYADSVVIGEAEDTWPALLKDFNSGKLKKYYKSSNNCELANLPLPRRDLIDPKKYAIAYSIQATRGCSFSCEFCSMASLFGSRTRYRPVEEVIEEIKSIDSDFFLLNDDNIGQGKDYFKEFFRQLIPLKKKWFGESTWNITNDNETLDLLKRSGCRALAVGFESLEPQHGVNKISSSIDNFVLYKEVVKKLHDNKITAMGNFIFGFDNESEEIFKRTLRFVFESRIDIGQFCILVPFPGSPLRKRLEKEGRITEKDWNHYSGNNLCFKLKNMSRESFLEKFFWVKNEFNSYRRISERVMRSALRGLSTKELGALLAVNLGTRKYIKNSSLSDCQDT
jgi:radical SAM superfamily enzyme YgiQ (UPF0313 family)